MEHKNHFIDRDLYKSIYNTTLRRHDDIFTTTTKA